MEEIFVRHLSHGCVHPWFRHRGFLSLIRTDVCVAEQHISQISKEKHREAQRSSGGMDQ